MSLVNKFFINIQYNEEVKDYIPSGGRILEELGEGVYLIRMPDSNKSGEVMTKIVDLAGMLGWIIYEDGEIWRRDIDEKIEKWKAAYISKHILVGRTST
jgi:hypothetical protein